MTGPEYAAALEGALRERLPVHRLRVQYHRETDSWEYTVSIGRWNWVNEFTTLALDLLRIDGPTFAADCADRIAASWHTFNAIRTGGQP